VTQPFKCCRHPEKKPVYIDGPFRAWAGKKHMNYFMLSADPDGRKQFGDLRPENHNWHTPDEWARMDNKWARAAKAGQARPPRASQVHDRVPRVAAPAAAAAHAARAARGHRAGAGDHGQRQQGGARLLARLPPARQPAPGAPARRLPRRVALRRRAGAHRGRAPLQGHLQPAGLGEPTAHLTVSVLWFVSVKPNFRFLLKPTHIQKPHQYSKSTTAVGIMLYRKLRTTCKRKRSGITVSCIF